MGIHFAHTQSEELRFLNLVSQQQTRAPAMRRECKRLDFLCDASWDIVVLIHKRKVWCLCLCQHGRVAGQTVVPLPHRKVALLCRWIVIWVSSALGPGAELKTRDSCDAPLLAHQPTEQPTLLDANCWVLNSQFSRFSFTKLLCHSQARFPVKSVVLLKNIFSFFVLLLFLLLPATLLCH